MPVTDHALKPAATSCTGLVEMRRIEDSIRSGSDAGDMGYSESLKTRDGTSEYRSARCKPVRKNRGPIARSHTIPIDTAKSPRLPPWEIFQRGPPVHQAANSHPGPHRKIFT
ncbi:hypothetical protein PXK00_18545, partial [Phaeobacter sp. QD34_3]|uniref:hypothetical protein n=1 Tax=unclassified Phaeobacter TaxID=2621772 RepID=UPI00237F7CEC